MFNRIVLICLLLSLIAVNSDAGVIKDLYQKLTNNNKTESSVKQSAPICGNGIFSTPDEKSLSPEIIFITNRQARSEPIRNNNRTENDSYRRRTQQPEEVVANEFRFHMENVTLEELERNGFNADAPVTFLMHGFTSGYPLQAWISAIVESYTIDRETDSLQSGTSTSNQQDGSNSNNYRQDWRQGRVNENRLKHNLFIINWHYAARGINYPRAVANIPIVASYATRFINDKLIGEAGVNPKRIQLIGHSLGAHLAGFIGKNTQSKLGRIYGLDPAGPCFGAISGPLYPSSKRLAPTDAEEVITIHTNTALLGIDKPLGQYSVFVEGGSVQPGCKDGGVLKSLQSLTFEGEDADTVSCSHSRAPNLLTYRHDQSDDDCQLVAYECKDWESFSKGFCGVCENSVYSATGSQREKYDKDNNSNSLKPVECKRIGLDWQYSTASSSGGNRGTSRRPSIDTDQGGYSSRRPYNSGSSTSSYEGQSSFYNRTSRRPNYQDSSEEYENVNRNNRTTSRRPGYGFSSTSSYDSGFDEVTSERNPSNYNPYSSRRPSLANQRERRESKNSTSNENSTSKSRESETEVEGKSLFVKTGDTQPYCVYHYQVILELNEPFEGKNRPPISLVLQDSETESESRRRYNRNNMGKNSLTSDDFGNKLNDRIYTDLLTSGRKLKRIDHATLLFRNGLKNGHRVLKSLQINYMSNIDSYVRRRFSVRLCPIKKQMDQPEPSTSSSEGSLRFYFEPCQKSDQSDSFGRETSRRPSYQRDEDD